MLTSVGLMTEEQQVRSELLSTGYLSATVLNNIMHLLHSTSAGRSMYTVPDSSLYLALQEDNKPQVSMGKWIFGKIYVNNLKRREVHRCYWELSRDRLNFQDNDSM